MATTSPLVLCAALAAGCLDGVGFRDPSGGGTEGDVGGEVPAPRGGAPAVWMPEARSLAIFGGMTPITGDTHVFDAEATRWRKLDPQAAPARRCHHTMVAVPGVDEALLFGGFSFDGRFNDTWRFDLSSESWSEVATGGTPPDPRCLHAAAVAASRGEMIVFGGIHGGGRSPGDFFDDTHILDLGSNEWTRLDAPGPSAREGASMFYVPAEDAVYLWGGKAVDVYTTELWRFDLDGRSWAEVPTTGVLPLGREDPVLFFDAARGRVVLYSGRNDGEPGALLGDHLQLDLGRLEWSELDPPAAPGPRWRASVAVDPEGDRGYVYGGWRDFGGAEAYADTWIFDLASDTWIEP